ncbi:MAG: hypothetical protein ACYDFV_10630, partial [Vulcanimicrobiaceae bacterium]
DIARVPFDEMTRTDDAERSAAIRARVVAARERQGARFADAAMRVLAIAAWSGSTAAPLDRWRNTVQ